MLPAPVVCGPVVQQQQHFHNVVRKYVGVLPEFLLCCVIIL